MGRQISLLSDEDSRIDEIKIGETEVIELDYQNNTITLLDNQYDELGEGRDYAVWELDNLIKGLQMAKDLLNEFSLKEVE